MPSLGEHFNQAKNNLLFLEQVNQQISGYWDWQVTICFYIALHLVNAHLVDKVQQHYRKHYDVEGAINPFGNFSCKFPKDEYYSYMALKGLARRSRYLVHDDKNNLSTNVHFTYDKHLARSVRHLDVLIKYIATIHTIDLSPISIACVEIKAVEQFDYFVKN